MAYNIVVALLDDAPRDTLSRMPHLQTKPHGNWVTFTDGVVCNPLCGTSRATLFTGQYTVRHGVTDHHRCWAYGESDSLAVALRRAGYATAIIGKYINYHPWTDPTTGEGYTPPGDASSTRQAPGWLECQTADEASGSDSYSAFTLIENRRRVAYGVNDYSTDVFYRKANDFISTAHEPFFCLIPTYAPHGPAVAATRHAGTYAAAQVPRNANFNPTTLTNKPTWLPAKRSTLEVSTMDTYYRNQIEAALALDEGIESVFTTMDARDPTLVDRTIFVVYNDNCYLNYQQRLQYKMVPYDPSANALMMVRYPGATQGDSDALVSNIDLAPTFCDVAGTRMPRMVDGMSLVPLLDGTLPADQFRSEVLIHNRSHGQLSPAITPDPPNCDAIRTYDRHLYVDWDDGFTELYDYDTDPYEMTNLSGNPTYAALEADLANRLSILQARAA